MRRLARSLIPAATAPAQPVAAALLALAVAYWLWGDVLPPPRPAAPKLGPFERTCGVGAAPGPASRLHTSLPSVTFDGVGLSDALEFLADVTGLRLKADWPALRAVGVDPQTPVTLDLGRPHKLADGLQLVLDAAAAAPAADDRPDGRPEAARGRPGGPGADPRLGFVVDGYAVRVGTVEGLAGTAVTRFHDVDDLVARAGSPAERVGAAAVLERPIREGIDPPSWSGRGGAGTLAWEVTERGGSCLEGGSLRVYAVVTQTPANQLAVATFLAGHDDRLRWQAAVRRFAGRSLLLVAATAMAGVVIRRLLLRVARAQPGTCRACGYDLRASPGRCPECGAAAASGDSAG